MGREKILGDETILGIYPQSVATPIGVIFLVLLNYTFGIGALLGI